MDLVRFHHINLSSSVVPRMDDFYRNVLALEELKGGTAASRTGEAYTAPVSFFRSGDVELHVATADLDLNFRMQQAVNPLIDGHIAFRTDDLAAVKRRLQAKGVNYSDYGQFAIKGWHQVFFLDPAGNVVEVHQVLDGE
jgi:glyoxylase I family protein